MSALGNSHSGSLLDRDASTQHRDPIVFIVYLRGLAPVLVVWAHLSGFWLYDHHASWRPYAFWYVHVAQPLNLYEDGGRLGVVLFFFVSGYVVTHASAAEPVSQFGLKRVFRLVPALWVSVIIVFLAREIARASGVGAPTGTGGHSVWSYVRGGLLLDQITGPTINGVTWTLVIEVLFYGLTATFMTLTRRRPQAATVAMLAITAMAAVTLNHFSDNVGIVNDVVFVGFLLLGRSLYLGHRGLIEPRRSHVLSLAVAVVTVALSEYCVPGSMSTVGGPQVSYLLGLLVFLVFMHAAPQSAPWPIRRLADVSYSLYLLHIPVGMLTIDLVLRSGAPFTVAFLVAVAASVIAATASYRLVERPAQRVVRRLVTVSAVSPPGPPTSAGLQSGSLEAHDAAAVEGASSPSAPLGLGR